MVEQGKIPGLLAPRLKPQVHALTSAGRGVKDTAGEKLKRVSGLRGLADTQEGRTVPVKPRPSSL